MCEIEEISFCFLCRAKLLAMPMPESVGTVRRKTFQLADGLCRILRRSEPFWNHDRGLTPLFDTLLTWTCQPRKPGLPPPAQTQGTIFTTSSWGARVDGVFPSKNHYVVPSENGKRK